MPQGAELLHRDATVRRFVDCGKRQVHSAFRAPRGIERMGGVATCRRQVEVLEPLLVTLDAATDLRPPRGDRPRPDEASQQKILQGEALSSAPSRGLLERWYRSRDSNPDALSGTGF